eukprot:scaffold86390_cov53-Phaeocystis_antarctica.AAC.1
MSQAPQDYTRSPRRRVITQIVLSGRGRLVHDLVKPTETRPRESRARSGGPFCHTQPVGNARHARRHLASTRAPRRARTARWKEAKGRLYTPARHGGAHRHSDPQPPAPPRDPPAAPARHTRALCHPAARPPAPPRDPPATLARHTRAPSHAAARPPAPPRDPPAAPARHGRAQGHPP